MMTEKTGSNMHVSVNKISSWLRILLKHRITQSQLTVRTANGTYMYHYLYSKISIPTVDLGISNNLQVSSPLHFIKITAIRFHLTYQSFKLLAIIEKRGS